MKRKLIARLSASACLLASPASLAASPSPVVLSAWSDARALPSEAALQGLLEKSRARKCGVAGIDLTKLSPDQLEAYRNMERLLASLPPSDPNRATFESTFARMRESYAAAAPLAPPRVPATLAEALKDAQGWLQQRDPNGLKAFGASPDAKDAGRASQAALAASMLGKPNAALAALLAAHRLAPNEPQHLANLGGVLVTLGLPGDALTVLDAAARLGKGQVGALGWSSGAVLSTNRGLALTALRRFPEAEAALRGAVAAEPMLSEANLGLSRVLTCQGKLAEAARFARAGQRRTATKTSTPATPTPTAPEEVRVTTRNAPDALTRLPAAFTFDLSRGRETALPNLKLPQTPAEAVALAPSYLRLRDELAERMKALGDRMTAIDAQLRSRPEPSRLTLARRSALWEAMLSVEEEPQMRALVMAVRKTEYDAPKLQTDFFNCEDGCIYHEITERTRTREEFRALCVPALETQNNKWRGAMHNHAANLGPYLKQGYKLLTGLAANSSDPLWHERASLYAEQWATARYYGHVATAAGWAAAMSPAIQAACIQGAASASPQVAPDLALPPADSCQDIFDDRSFSLSVDVLSFKISCDAIQMGTASPGWIGAFGQLNHTFGTEEYTVTVGVQQSVAVPGTSVGVESKQGVYVTWGEGGLTDAGVSVKTSVKVGVKNGDASKATGSDEIGALSGKWSFIASSGR